MDDLDEDDHDEDEEEVVTVMILVVLVLMVVASIMMMMMRRRRRRWWMPKARQGPISFGGPILWPMVGFRPILFYESIIATHIINHIVVLAIFSSA